MQKEEKEYGQISMNQLQSVLLDVANLPKDAYTQYLEELRKEILVFTTNYYIDKDGKRYTLQDETSPCYDKIQEY